MVCLAHAEAAMGTGSTSVGARASAMGARK